MITSLSNATALATCQNSRIKDFNFHIVIIFTLPDSIEKKNPPNAKMSKTKRKIASAPQLCL